MIGSFFVGAALAGAYFYSMQRTSLNPAQGSLSSGLLRSLVGFSLRVSFLTIILIALARATALQVTGVIISFMTVFIFLLFGAAARVFLSDLKNRPPARRV